MVHKFTIFIAFVLSLAPVAALAQENAYVTGRSGLEPVRLEGWQYRWGDSPSDQNGVFEWLHADESDPHWEDISFVTTSPEPGDQNFVWYRKRLPVQNWPNPTLYFPTLMVAFEVYLDTTRIYNYGEMQYSRDAKYSSVTNHLVPLPAGFQGKMLSVRVYSPDAGYIGMGQFDDFVTIGSENDLVKSIFRHGAEGTLLGCLFIFVGLFSGVLTVRRLKDRAFTSLAFGIFAFFIGVFYVFENPLAAYLIESPGIKLYARHGSYLLFPVGLYLFLQHVIGANKVTQSLWLSHLLAALVVVALDVLNVVPLPAAFIPYSVLFIVTIVIAAFLVIKAAVGGNPNARIFVWGFTALSVTGLNDILMGMGYLPFWHWTSQWGTLVFILTLAYILERLFQENTRRLRVYSRELEQKSDELREYSRTLEQRVAERTQDLDVKNKELGETLDRLKDAQQQLILKEKMASLGDLVAGVAHEINNPIGAINSASDVSSRCLDRLQETVEKGESVQSVKDNMHYQTAMQLLRENTRIAVEGSGRVTKIVRSLRNFARLDEAELQEADIHEGIDSTLTLVHHELKHNVEVVKEYGDIPRIRCYPNQLNQVFMNLFVNAAHAIEGKGTLRITTSADDKNVFIKIVDTGRGIPPENIEKIFDPGFTTKGSGVGTGLGLSISYNIIQKHGGILRVDSEVGRGTAFEISLPA
jgi:signal transduction histidine kinase